MLAEAGASWKDRLIRKKIIESAIAEYNVLLDDAARSFQVGLTYGSSSKLRALIG
jgi:hypothetical protein